MTKSTAPFLMTILIIFCLLATAIKCYAVNTEKQAIQISNYIFNYLDKNNDNVIDVVEWKESEHLPIRLKYLKNTKLRIPFEQVDRNKNSLIERDELHIFISGVLVNVYDKSITALEDDSLDYHKIQESSKLLFSVSLKKNCKNNITDISEKWLNYTNCIRISNYRTCMSLACNSGARPTETDLKTGKVTKVLAGIAMSIVYASAYTSLHFLGEGTPSFLLSLTISLSISLVLALATVISMLMIRH